MEVGGGGLVQQKAHPWESHPLPPWDAIASPGLAFGLLTLEALIQPWVPPLKREAGKPEGAGEVQWDIHFPTVTIIFKRHITTLQGEYSKNILNFIDN